MQTDLQKIYRMWKLDSVGAFISTDTGLVRTAFADGAPDLDDDQATHLDDCCDEWFSGLDPKDTVNVARVRYAVHHNRKTEEFV